MITYKDHMEISKGISIDDDGKVSLGNKNLLERIELIREIDQVYPLRDSKRLTPYIQEKFTVNGSVKSMVLGQFIMSEQILTGKEKFNTEEEMELALLQLLLRPKHHKEFDNTSPSDEQQNREEILNSPVQDLYNVLNRYLANREQVLFKEFAGVFYEVNEETEEVEEKTEVDDTQVGRNFYQQWYWYSIVRTLGKEDIRVYPEIYMLKMDVVLPEMSYLAQKNKVESAQQRQDAALSKL